MLRLPHKINKRGKYGVRSCLLPCGQVYKAVNKSGLRDLEVSLAVAGVLYP